MRSNKICGVVLCLAATLSLHAQIGGSGSIQGVISDTSGAIIPGASVVGTNIATGVSTTRTTTEAGYYVLSPLVAGAYSVTVSAAGFQTLKQEQIVVDALSVVGFNATLQVGNAAEQVTITDTPPVLNTSDARMGQTVRNEVYTSLPLAMGTGGASINAPRDPTSFVALMPGVTGYGGNRAGNILGAQTGSQEVYVEGISMTGSVLQGEVRFLSLGISIESVDQFQLETANAAVMYSGQGATNFVLKSGTNAFHGAVYENLRNSVLDARGFFARIRPTNRQNEFGTTLGGPIRKDRIFFFGTYGGYRTKQDTTPTFLSIPTLRERTGDFSELLPAAAIYDPQTTNCASGPCTRAPFAGNLIPANRISPISNFFQAELPQPSNANIQNNYLGSVPVGFKNDSVTGKVDWSLTSAHQFYALFSRGRRGMTTPYRNGNIPLPYTDTRTVTETMTTAQARHTWVATNTVLNQISLGFSRFWVPITNATIDGKWPQKAGLKGLPPGEADSAFPYITFAGPNAPGGWRVGNSEAFDEAMNNTTLQDNLQWTRGKHAITVGFQAQWLQANEKLRSYGSLARWTFSNTQTAGFNAAGTLQTATGNGYATYLLGAVSTASITDDWVVGTGARFRTYGWWLQDNVKVNRRLTLNLGLRHDIWMPWVEVRDRMSWLDTTKPNPAVGGFPGALVFAGDVPNGCKCRNDIQTYYKNFQPRVGFAYGLTRKTVVRGGYSMTAVRRGAAGGSGTKIGTGVLGFSANPTFNSLDNGISPAFYWEAGVPAYQKAPFFDSTLNTGFYTGVLQGGSMTYGDPVDGGRPSRYQNWSFGFQHSLTSTLTLDLSYVGSNGHYLSGGSRGIWTNQMHQRYLPLANLLQAQATPANIAAANQIVPGIGLPFANFSGVLSQMLRPFPQYAGISDVWGNVGNHNYNSLQFVASKTISHGLNFNFNYTFAKAFNDMGSRSYYWSEKAQGTDPAHIVNALVVYKLPFGKGHRLGDGNVVVRKLLGNWQISGTTTYRSGVGLGSIGANCNLPNAGTCFADYNPGFTGPVRINGDYGSGDLLGPNPPSFLDRNAFAAPAAYTYGNTPRTMVFGLLNPPSYNQNVSLRREFFIRESLRLVFQADSLNVFNLVNFGNPATGINSANFGRITSQSNTPRVVQFSARIAF